MILPIASAVVVNDHNISRLLYIFNSCLFEDQCAVTALFLLGREGDRMLSLLYCGISQTESKHVCCSTLFLMHMYTLLQCFESSTYIHCLYVLCCSIS